MDIKRLMILAVVGLLVGLYESTAMTFLAPPLIYFHPAILILAFLVTTDRTRGAYAFALGAGLMCDVFSLESSRLMTVELLLLTLLLKIIALRLLTNQSLYASLALDGMARLSDWLWRAGASFLHGLFVPEFGYRIASFQNLWPVLLVDAILLSLVFFFGSYVLRRFVDIRAFFKASPKTYGSS